MKKFYDDYERNKPLEKNYLENYLKNKGNSHFIEKKKVLEIIESLSSKNISLLDLGGGLGEFAYMAKIKNSKRTSQYYCST